MEIDKTIQKRFAQYLTNTEVSSYMASLFSDIDKSECSILDPGAGTGVLGLALHNHYGAKSNTTFVELEEQMYQRLQGIIVQEINTKQSYETLNKDFIELGLIWRFEGKKFDRIIMNPPYYKLDSSSTISQSLKNIGIYAPNIYVAFMWIALEILQNEGELVAIVPRSFCNGLYFSKFRNYIGHRHSVEHIHIFKSRKKIFSKDDVLQENIIIKIKKKEQTPFIRISYSNDHLFNRTKTHTYESQKILNIGQHQFIRIPTQTDDLTIDELSIKEDNSNINVSTGPIVDFRQKDKLSLQKTCKFSVPLLYPIHMEKGEISWPKENIKKYGQYYQPTTKLPEKDKNILPLNGYYVVVRRISSKEEKKRIVASIVSPKYFNTRFITFENHLNYYHRNKEGLKEDEAKGLYVYLNSVEVDNYFQSISGSTQVNVTDLQTIPLPSRSTLQDLSKYYESGKNDYFMKELI